MGEALLPRRRHVLPGFPLSLGITLTYLGVVVLLPLAAVFLKAAGISWEAFRTIVFSPRTLAAYRLSFTAAAVAAVINLVFGSLLAWVLERYRFPGRRFVDGMVDLPFALPTAVAGIALAFARAVGEYGSVIFIAGNMPLVSEIAPLLIVIKLEQFDYAGATVVATLMLVASFILLLATNLLQAWTRKRQGG